MGIRRAWPTIAAAVLSSTVMSAQSNPRTATETAAQSNTSKTEETSVTLVGCLQRETDYRRTHNLGSGGAVGTGIGSGDEFVLINASPADAAAPATTNIDCAREATGEAYELTGPREDALKPFVGRAVQISGIQKKAAVEQPVGTTGTGAARPTGGSDPLKRDLRLFEVNVTSFQEVTPATPVAAAAPPPATPPPAFTPESQPIGTSGTERALPRTASPFPIVGLFGLLSWVGALGLRVMRDR
jgi:hypothetical protein